MGKVPKPKLLNKAELLTLLKLRNETNEKLRKRTV
jgi:hypothetical protein